MTHRFHASMALISAVALTSFADAADAQRRPAGQPQATQRIEVSLKVGDQTYQSNSPGRCTHAPVAAIYQIVSELWSVQQSQDARSLTLSFWRPKDGSAEMVTLSLGNGSTSHEVNTVRGGAARARARSPSRSPAPAAPSPSTPGASRVRRYRERSRAMRSRRMWRKAASDRRPHTRSSAAAAPVFRPVAVEPRVATR